MAIGIGAFEHHHAAVHSMGFKILYRAIPLAASTSSKGGRTLDHQLRNNAIKSYIPCRCAQAKIAPIYRALIMVGFFGSGKAVLAKAVPIFTDNSVMAYIHAERRCYGIQCN